ncbi:MAG TPA: RagB/SusD family nutrient uptake outer membrane protein [Gemmatirosa sp.]
MPPLAAQRARPVRRHLAVAAALGTVAAAACHTDVNDPGIVSPTALQSATALPTVIAGATGDFAVAYAGNNYTGDEGVILLGGLRADEWRNSDLFSTRLDVDRGTITTTNASVGAVYRNLNTARRSAETAITTFVSAAPTDYRRGLALSFDAYTYVLLAENFCSGIPFTELQSNGASFAYGQPLTTQQVFQIAAARFDTAVTIAEQAAADQSLGASVQSSAQEVAYLARVGRARALVGLNQYAAAAASVAPVPPDFVFNIEYSANTQRENNGVYAFNAVNARWSVADHEGVNGLPFVSAQDPRVPVDSAGTGVDNVTPLLLYATYSNYASPIPLATGTEARLIAAEAALKLGAASQALDTLNVLRSGAGLPVLTLQSGSTAQAQQLMAERAFWLFATGHRLGDMRRLIRSPSLGGYGFAFTSVFPVGPYPKGGAPYGTDANLPIPIDELNNPNFKQCIDRTT